MMLVRAIKLIHSTSTYFYLCSPRSPRFPTQLLDRETEDAAAAAGIWGGRLICCVAQVLHL